MRPEVLKFLYDIRQACDLIEQFTQGKSYKSFENDQLLQSAVERQFMIAGEALFQALKVEPTLSESITDHRRIINFRHVMVHGYATIEPATVWGVVEGGLATLREEVETFLSDVNSEQ